MGDLMDVLTWYAESDNTKDPLSDEEKSDKGKKAGGKGQQQNNSNGQNNGGKRKGYIGSSDLVANTNTENKGQRQNDGSRRQSSGNRPLTYEEALKAPCSKHSYNGKPSSHSWENCYVMQEFA
jgi:hypothetical protein